MVISPSQSQEQQQQQKQQQEVQESSTNSTSLGSVSSSTNCLKASQIKKEQPDLVDEEQMNTKPRKEMSCPHCERTFVHRNSLLYHIRSHTGHRPHQCELCGKSFFAAGALKVGLKILGFLSKDGYFSILLLHISYC